MHATGRCVAEALQMQTCECLLVWQELVQLFNSGEHQKATDIMVDHIMFLNPGADRQTMLIRRIFDEDGRLERWNLIHCKINQLPELFSTLVCRGNLFLERNNLRSLPESFGNITVGGDLSLWNNPKLKGIPKRFPNVKGYVNRSVHQGTDSFDMCM